MRCVAYCAECICIWLMCAASVPARLPVEIRVFDAAGQELDGVGYACAEGGVCTLTVRTNLNDPPGGYRIVCRDRASGIVSETR